MDIRQRICYRHYENIYVKQFVLYEDEELHYYFQDTIGNEITTTEKKVLTNAHTVKTGKYGKLNAMLSMSPANQRKAIMDFKRKRRWQTVFLGCMNNREEEIT